MNVLLKSTISGNDKSKPRLKKSNSRVHSHCLHAVTSDCLFYVAMMEYHILGKLETRDSGSGQGSGGWELQDQGAVPDEGLFVT